MTMMSEEQIEVSEHVSWFDKKAELDEEKDHLTSWHGYQNVWLFRLRSDLMLVHRNLHAKEGLHL